MIEGDNNIIVCPGCLRAKDDIISEKCGSQRCPEMILIPKEQFKELKIKRMIMDKIIEGN